MRFYSARHFFLIASCRFKRRRCGYIVYYHDTIFEALIRYHLPSVPTEISSRNRVDYRFRKTNGVYESFKLESLSNTLFSINHWEKLLWCSSLSQKKFASSLDLSISSCAEEVPNPLRPQKKVGVWASSQTHYCGRNINGRWRGYPAWWIWVR